MLRRYLAYRVISKNIKAEIAATKACNSFYTKQDMVQFLVNTITVSCSEEELYTISNNLGRYAHEKGRNKIRRNKQA